VLALLVLVSLTVAHAQQRPDRSHAPALGPVPQLKIPPIEKRTLGNGLPVWIVEQAEVPLASRCRRGGQPGRRAPWS